MVSNEAIQAIRYSLLLGGGIAIGRGWASKDQMMSLVDLLTNPAFLGAISTIGTGFWGLYTKWNTRSVPNSVAARSDVPTVSPLTGKVE